MQTNLIFATLCFLGDNMHMRHCQDECEGTVDEGRYKDWETTPWIPVVRRAM
jgi:hypothetical protein